MPGDAVVTGFSGTLSPQAGKALPRGKSAIDVTFIDPDGASVRVFDVSRPGVVWDGRLISAPTKFSVPAKDVGQVFGVALDDATPPNIYVAATSIFGLNLVRRGRDGRPERRKRGGPGVGWMRGQFGLDLQGGPGAIYKIDGRTGLPTLFANVTLDGVPNPAPGLGSLAYDPEHKQLFVSDLYTGMIHRFDLAGRELGRYDHGVAGRSAAKLPPVAFDPRNRPNIASARFNSENPGTWGFAPAARQVWGLAVHDGRLYYSVLSGPQIWSVGIARDGSFASDPHWELDVPAPAGALPVTDIAFTHGGAMILAQRAPIAAAYDYSAFTKPAEPLVLRFLPKGPNDPPAPGRWEPAPQEYAIGLAGDFRNANGGVALGYGYRPDGSLDTGACQASLWATGQDLRNDRAMRSRLERGGPLLVHGLQANPADLVRPGNEPPLLSYFVDYDGKFNDPRATGHIGSVRIYTQPCAPAAYAQPVPAIVPVAAPGGCIGRNCRSVCTPTCVCPPGTELEDGECVKIRKCPPGTYYLDGKCLPRFKAGEPNKCTPPMIANSAGACVCPLDMQMINGHCVPSHECRPPFVPGPIPGSCICPEGSKHEGHTCVPNMCPAGMVPGPCFCPPGTKREGHFCVETGEIIFTKKVVYDGPVALPSQPYPVNVTCGGNTTTLNLLPNVPQSVGNIPYGTTCTYNEPTPSTPANACPPRFVPTWTTVFAPPSPPGVTVNAPTTHVDVTNTLICKPHVSTIDVKIEKTGATTPACNVKYYDFSLRLTNAGAAFPGNQNIGVTDTVPNGMKFDSAGGGSDWNCQTLPANAGTTITCTYTGAGPTAGQVLPGIGISAEAVGSAPYPPFTNCASVALGGGNVDSNSGNNNACTTVAKPASCKRAGLAPPTCPKGTELLGNECVPVPVPLCEKPRIFDPATGVCSCPLNTIDRDGKCVPNVVRCNPPLVYDRKTGLCIKPPMCPPPSRWNPLTRRCECGSGIVAGTNTTFIVGKLVQIDGAGALPDAHWGINLACTGLTNTNASGTAWTASSMTDFAWFTVPACSACTVTEAPRPAPDVCPPGTFAILQPPTYAPSNQVVTGVNAGTVMTNHIICNAWPPMSCPSPLVAGPTGCHCPRNSTFNPSTGRCVSNLMECEAGFKRVEGICVLQKCPRGTVRRGDDCVKLPKCRRGSVRKEGICIPNKRGHIERRKRKRHHCPKGEFWNGKECSKRQSRRPRFEGIPRILIPGIPGFGFGNHGNRGGGHPGAPGGGRKR